MFARQPMSCEALEIASLKQRFFCGGGGQRLNVKGRESERAWPALLGSADQRGHPFTREKGEPIAC